MRVLHICSGVDPRSGGPTRSITGLCRALAGAGVDTTLYVRSPRHAVSEPGALRVLYGSGGGLTTTRSELVRLFEDVRPELVHLHGLWLTINHLAMCQARRRSIPVILSPRGMLDPWALRQKALKKRFALWLYQRRDLRAVRAFHATASQEAENIRASGAEQPVCVVANGVELPDVMPPRVRLSENIRTALFLSRLHPGKGLLDLVAAWSRLRPQGWRVRVVGPDVCGHRAVVEAALNRAGLLGQFEFVGELDDQAKWSAYTEADLFVHPSHSENFGMSIAEALASGLPVIATKGAPWSELVGEPSRAFDLQQEGSVQGTSTSLPGCVGRAGWWVDIGVESLAEALREAISLTDDVRRDMGGSGRRLVQKKYTWSAVATQMKDAYTWLIHAGTAPTCMRF
ncbi:MAG: glycosyltransferase [Lentisphaerae bacterium]|nr:glycosyltransferase [Lentisphaerota bacterium]